MSCFYAAYPIFSHFPKKAIARILFRSKQLIGGYFSRLLFFVKYVILRLYIRLQ